MNTAYIYRLINQEGLIYIGSHLVKEGKTIYTDVYSGSSQDPRINSQIVSKEILCYLKSSDRQLLYNHIQLLEHQLILDLDAINNSQYANATSMGVIGLNYKRLGGIISNLKSPLTFEQRSDIGKKGAAAIAHIRTAEWHRKGQKAAAKLRRDDWTEELYNKVIEQYKASPNKKAYAIWNKLGKPTKSYKSIFHMLKHVSIGKTWQEVV